MRKKTNKLIKIPNYIDKIVLVQQFHIPTNQERQKEIQDTLRKNVENNHISKIVLLNERMYTASELGFPNSSIPSNIQQIVIDSRLSYQIAFRFIQRCIKHRWVILSNNDIYYDSSITNLFSLLKRTDIHSYPQCVCLTRIELQPLHQPLNLSACQDSWIFYSEECPPPRFDTNFHLGIPGCDNRIAYILKRSHSLINCPKIIHSYHNHMSNIRYYDHNTEKIPGPYAYIAPI